MWLPPDHHPKLKKKAYKKARKPLRSSLLARQLAHHAADFPVLLVLAGIDGAGKHRWSLSMKEMDRLRKSTTAMVSALIVCSSNKFHSDVSAFGGAATDPQR